MRTLELPNVTFIQRLFRLLLEWGNEELQSGDLHSWSSLISSFNKTRQNQSVKIKWQNWKAVLVSIDDDHKHPAHGLRTPRESFFQKSQTFRLGQTNWAESFWGIWGIFGWTINTHFVTVGSLSMFLPLFLQKTKPLYPTPKYLFGSGVGFEFGSQRIWDLAFVCP